MPLPPPQKIWRDACTPACANECTAYYGGYKDTQPSGRSLFFPSFKMSSCCCQLKYLLPCMCCIYYPLHNINTITHPSMLDKRTSFNRHRTSDLKPKCTQHATPFWGTVFHALLHGVIHFVLSVRSRNHFLIG